MLGGLDQALLPEDHSVERVEVLDISKKAIWAYFLGQSYRRLYRGKRWPRPKVDGCCIVISAGQVTITVVSAETKQ